MNSYDRSGVAEKLRVMVGREDFFANLEATGLRVLRVFMMGYRLVILRLARDIGYSVQIKLLLKTMKQSCPR
jgi:hypothetical protein